MIDPLGLAAGVFFELASAWAVLQLRSGQGEPKVFVPAAGFLFWFGLHALILSSSLAHMAFPRLVVNVASPIAAFCLLAWFLNATHDKARSRVVPQLMLLIVALAVAVTAWMSDSDRVINDVAAGVGARGFASVTFALAVEGYLALTLAQGAIWAAIYARRVPHSSSRVGFVIFCGGLAALSAVAGARGGSVAVSAWKGWSPTLVAVHSVAAQWRPLCFAVILVGALCSTVGSLVHALPAWRAHRSRQLQLRPLRRLLYTAFPDHAIDEDPVRWWDWLLPVRVHWRFYRCLIEILDGLDQLRPFYDQCVAEAAVARGAMDITDDGVLAEVIWDATRTHIGIVTAATREALRDGLIGDEIDEATHQALVESAAQRRQQVARFEGLDHIGEGTMEQVTLRLTRLADTVARLRLEATPPAAGGTLTPAGR